MSKLRHLHQVTHAPQPLQEDGGHKPKLLCSYPGCFFFAKTQVRLGGWPLSRYVPLCVKHRPAWDAMNIPEIERFPWQPRRKRQVGG